MLWNTAAWQITRQWIQATSPRGCCNNVLKNEKLGYNMEASLLQTALIKAVSDTGSGHHAEPYPSKTPRISKPTLFRFTRLLP